VNETPIPALVLASVDIGVGWFLYVHLGPVGYPLLVVGLLVLFVAALRTLRDGATETVSRPNQPDRS
jgi:hypothetical protein